MGRQIGDETVLPGTFQVNDAVIAAVIKRSGAAGHHVGIQINRIYRIGNRNVNVGGKNLLDIAGVTFGAIADKYFLGGYIGAPLLIVCAGNFFT